MARPGKKTVQGSERAPVAGAKVVGPVRDDELVDVTVRLRPAAGGLAPHAVAAGALTRAQLAEEHGASAEDVRAVEDVAHEHGLTVRDASPEERAVRLRGRAGAMQDAFGVLLNRAEHPGGTFRQREGSVEIPGSLADIVTGVFGLDDRPQARPHFRAAPPPAGAAGGKGAVKPHAAGGGFTPQQIATTYRFPTGVTGAHQTIGIVELGGGFLAADLAAFATEMGLPPLHVISVSVDGGHNAPGVDANADGEVALDIEVAGGVAPGATIVVYFTPDTSDRSFLDAVSAAVHDQVHHPDVISISWGGPENAWSLQAMQAMDEIFQAATAIGVPVFVAAGDDGASDGEAHGLHADFPASAPHAIACGGTRLAAPKQVRTSEVVWNELATGNGATGGGFSAVFPAPAWQKPVLGTHTMRGVPDLAADADPLTGYRVRVRHRDGVIGGTSAVAPLMAGLVALCNQKAGHNPGALIQKLYALGSPSAAFFDVVKGNNHGFSAGKGWDPCTGLGVPVGDVFAEKGWVQKIPALAVKGAAVAAQPA